MQKRQRLPKSQVTEMKTIDPDSDRRLLSRERKKLRKEQEKVRRLEYNGRRRENRKQRKLVKVEQEQTREVAEAVEEQYGEQFKEWKREKEGLKKNIARLNARSRREPSKIRHAVQVALKHSDNPNAAQPTVRYVKDKRGIVQNWARNAIVRLVNQGVPMSKTWSVTKANADSTLGVVIVGKWSDRTSRRVVREGGIAAGLMVIEYVLSCIGS